MTTTTSRLTADERARLAKAPAWIQRIVQLLERDLDSATARAENARQATDPDDSNVLLEDVLRPGQRVGLGKRPTLVFPGLPRTRENELHVEYEPGGGLEVRASYGRPSVVPVSGNVLTVRSIAW